MSGVDLFVVENFMTKDPFIISKDLKLTEVLKEFLKRGITASPVVDQHKNEILGMITELSLARCLLVYRLREQKKDRVAHYLDLLEPFVNIEQGEELAAVIKAMLKSPTKRVLITEGRQIKGILSPKDLLRFLGGESSSQHNLFQELEATKDQLKALSFEVKDLKKDLLHFEKMFMDSPYMMHAVDKSGTIVYANNMAHAALGYDPSELIGKSIYDIYSDAVLNEVKEGFHEVQEKGFHKLTYSAMKTKNREIIKVDIVSTALFDARGDFVHTISIWRKIDSEQMLRSLSGIIDHQDLVNLSSKPF